jgi:uncharacterized protein YjbI with pentapeptide repeats
MKLVKPMVVSFSFRTFRMLAKDRLCLTTLIGFSLEEGARRLIPEVELWPAIGEATAGIIDEGLPKARAEVLVYGSCFAPGGRAVVESFVRVRLGRGEMGGRLVDKRLAVTGDRFWREAALGSTTSEPVPFTTMPIGWERAFGGPTDARNPYGRGCDPVALADGARRTLLPNVEHPGERITRSSQRPEPAGLGPLEMGWPQRQSKAGTYDARWLEEDFPGYARNTDPTFFNTALSDQHIDGFFRGNEEYALDNLHPSRPVLRGVLPGIAARVLLRRKQVDGIEDVKTRLDTIVFLPDKEIGILVFRGMTSVLEDDATDIACALAACEDVAEPRSVEHYRKALDSRLDKEKSPLLALMDRDLVPSFAAGSDAAALDLPVEGTETGAEATAAAGGPTAGAAGTEAGDAESSEDGPSTVPSPEPARAGLGPPKPTAPEVLSALQEDGEEMDPELAKLLPKLEAADAKALEGYRKTAHFRPPAPPLVGQPLDHARELVRGLRASGRSLAALDLTGCDLSGEDLAGADLSKALLEAANLTRTNLAGANMAGAVVAHALIRGARFDGANLEGANLGAGLIETTSFAGATLRGATFGRVKLRSASLRDTDLTDVDWLEAEIGAVDFEGALARLDILSGSDLTGCRFARARLKRSNFIECALDGVDFAEANLDSATFLTTTGRGADFRRSSLKKLTAVEGCSFEGATFAGADLTGAVLRGSNLRGASFEGACLEGADLSECDLTGANLSGARAKQLLLVRANLTGATMRRANLMEAMLKKATLHGADLSGTNLFLANLALVRVDTATKVTGANLKRALMLPRAPKALA